MARRTDEDIETAQLSLNSYLQRDIIILQLMGMFSMGSVLKGKKPKMSFLELLPCAAGLGTITFGLIGDMYNAYDIAREDWVESMQVFSAIFCSAFTLYKV
uniref:Uncharacterized protein n=1 Tax=Bracon brevicornis TaxID=1563983 RepID=A0A6V7LLX1_9HYME